MKEKQVPRGGERRHLQKSRLMRFAVLWPNSDQSRYVRHGYKNGGTACRAISFLPQPCPSEQTPGRNHGQPQAHAG